MNTFQNVFALFFAISWGIVSNVLPRWKPFHYAAITLKLSNQALWRCLLSWGLFNLIPWIFFVIVMVNLADNSTEFLFAQNQNTLARLREACPVIFLAILPGLIPFGCYHVWISLIEQLPDFFYEKIERKESPHSEPTQTSLNITEKSLFCNPNFWMGLIYCSSALLPFLF